MFKFILAGILKNAPPKPAVTSIPNDFFDSDEPVTHKQNIHVNSSRPAVAPEGLEAPSEDFEVAESNGDTPAQSARSETIPEGFFDDPIMDAKVCAKEIFG